MARIRSIKPEFFTSPDIAALDIFARLTYIGLWTHMDDFGRCLDEPRLICAALYPLDPDITPSNVRAVIDALHANGHVIRYEANGRRYLQATAWHHQVINRKSKPKCPGPDAFTEDSLSSHGGLTPGTGNREQVLTLPDRQTRDAMWDALEAELGKAETDTARTNRGRTVKELAAIGADPAEVAARCAAYRRKYPHAALTDAALRKHWSDLTPKAPKAERDIHGNLLADGAG